MEVSDKIWYLLNDRLIHCPRMHVFADLRPYICTFDNCPHELVQFSDRIAWADHEFSKHRISSSWTCPECSAQCNAEVEWAQHLKDCHQRTFVGSKLQVAKTMACKIRPKPAEEESCPLCGIVLGKPRRAFVKHVGRHMEEIALMALPRDIDELSETSSVISNTGNTSQSTTQASTSFTADFPCPHCPEIHYRQREVHRHIIERHTNQGKASEEDIYYRFSEEAREAAPVVQSQDYGILDSSIKPRCQRCKGSKKGCDRQRPCQRCKDAGIGIEGCISEVEDEFRKDHLDRHAGVAVKQGGDDSAALMDPLSLRSDSESFGCVEALGPPSQEHPTVCLGATLPSSPFLNLAMYFSR